MSTLAHVDVLQLPLSYTASPYPSTTYGQSLTNNPSYFSSGEHNYFGVLGLACGSTNPLRPLRQATASQRSHKSHAVLSSLNSSKRSMACLPSAMLRDRWMKSSLFSIQYRKASARPLSVRASSISALALFHACASRSSKASSSCCKASSEDSIKCAGVGSEFKECLQRQVSRS
jgi:hypothetical protein